MSGGPRSLDPTLTNDSASAEIMVQVYDTLFTLNFDTLEPVPNLAVDYAFENDAFGNLTLLRLFLRQGVLFHNGDEFKASDVKFSLDRAMVSPHISHIAGEIQGTQIINDYEVLVSMKAPFVPILNNLAHTAMSIVNERAVNELGDSYPQNPVGTGALKFVRWVVGNRIELTRWDEYWGEAPRLKNVTIRYIADDQTRIIELETGGIDITYVPPQDISRVEANPDLRMLKRRSLSMSYIGFNTQMPPFDDLRVRQAVSYAVDMDAMVDAVLMGVGIRAMGPLSSVVWASAANVLPRQEYNPERARQLLAEAGFPNGFTATIATNENPQRIDTAQIMQSMLAQVGITLEINIMEWAAYLNMLDRGEQQLFILGWVTVTGDPDYGLEIFHSRSFGEGGNNSRFRDPQVDHLLDLARQETNHALRYDLYIEVQQLIHAGYPMLYMNEGESTIAVRRNVRGFEINPAGHHPFWTVWFED
jgi:peptide/nickel transport system substrate-binding protein